MIWVTGDVHGDLRRFQAPPMRRMKRGDSLIICGDFGFLWNGSEEEKKVLDKLGRKKYNILFVEGTHENFDLLESFPVEDFCGGKARRIRDNIFHLMRGQVYTMEGKTFFTFGGGEAEDTLLRKEAGTYWPRSMPNIEEMREGVENLRRVGQKVDYIITHSPYPSISTQLPPWVEGNALTIYLQEVEKNVRYRMWCFGSLHINRSYTGRHQALFDDFMRLTTDDTHK